MACYPFNVYASGVEIGLTKHYNAVNMQEGLVFGINPTITGQYKSFSGH